MIESGATCARSIRAGVLSFDLKNDFTIDDMRCEAWVLLLSMLVFMELKSLTLKICFWLDKEHSG